MNDISHQVHITKNSTAIRVTAVFILLAIVFLAMLVLNVNVGGVTIPPKAIFHILLNGGSDGTLKGNVNGKSAFRGLWMQQRWVGLNLYPDFCYRLFL